MTKLIPNYVLSTVALSMGGFLNGYDSGAIGGITTMPQFASSLGHLTPFMHGFVVSLIMLTGAFPSVIAGQLADKLGRLRTIALGAVLFLLGAILQGSAYTLPQFCAGRAFSGLGEGVFLGIISVYVCEIAPSRSRGRLAGVPQFATTAGIVAGYFTCYSTVSSVSDSMAWRLPYVVQGTGALMLLLSCFMVPESPRWLALNGRKDEALAALEKLQVNMVAAERESMTSSEQGLSLSPWQSFALLFKRGYRARTVLALFVLGMVQLSGIDAIIYYAPILFNQAGISADSASFLASGLSAILMLVITIPAFLMADKWGRRTSALSGGVTLSFLMFLMGSLYAAGVVHPFGAARWVVIVSVFAFGLTYCATWAIMGKLYASEIQPAHTRAAASSVAQGLNFFMNWVVAFITPILLDKSAFGAYFLFGGLALGTVLVLAAYMPETRGRSLESIQEAFQQHQTPSLRHHMGKVIPALRKRTQHGRQGESTSNLELRPSAAAVSGASTGGILRVDVVA